MSETFSRKALDLILRNEGLDEGGWPGGHSGVTIGRGYDLGYNTKEEFAKDWGGLLTPEMMEILSACCGFTGDDARKLTAQLRGKIIIPRDAADKVFFSTSIPKFVAQTKAAFPGVETLPDDAQGALVSLVFNRGVRMKDLMPSMKERLEMRRIRAAVGDYAAGVRGEPWVNPPIPTLYFTLIFIAKQLRSMKRLWEGKKLDGLVARREEEAQLVESAIPAAAGAQA